LPVDIPLKKTILNINNCSKRLLFYIGGSQNYRKLNIEVICDLVNNIDNSIEVYLFDDPNTDRKNVLNKLITRDFYILKGLSLPELAFIANSSTLYIGVEGGVSHYLSTQISSIILFSPKSYLEHYKIWLPITKSEFQEYIFLKNIKVLKALDGNKVYYAILNKPRKIFNLKPYIYEEPFHIRYNDIVL